MITGVFGVAQTYQANLVGLRVMQDLRNALYAHLQHMPLAVLHLDADGGDPVAALQRRRRRLRRS